MAGTSQILLVQDDDSVRRSYRVNLELDGFTVVEASNGEEALRLARQAPPDLIVLDLMLPIVDGWHALGELKTDKELSPVPVVILTGSAEESEELRALERGALAFLGKPIDIEDLLVAVRRVFAPRR